MEFGVLGPLAVWKDGRELSLRAAKQRAVLALLLLRANEVVPTARLVDELWGERPPATAVKTVQVYVSQLRKAARRGRDRDAAGRLRAAGRGRVRSIWSGSRACSSAAARCSAPAPPTRPARCCGTRWRSGAGRRWRTSSTRRSPATRSGGWRSCGWSRSACGSRPTWRSAAHAEVVPELEALVREHPLRERLRELLILALYRAGRQADALAAYQDARATLVDELGLDPGAVAARAREGDPRCRTPRSTWPPARARRICRPAPSRSSSPTSKDRPSCSPGSAAPSTRRCSPSTVASSAPRSRTRAAARSTRRATRSSSPSRPRPARSRRPRAPSESSPTTRAAGPDRHPHRRAAARPDRLRRPRRPARRADLRRRPRRAGADLAVDARAGRGRAARRRRAARPRRAPAQGPRRARSGSRSS